MKKVLRGICLMGVVAMLATSCNKKNEETATIQTFNQSFEVVDSDFGIGEGERVQYVPSSNKLYFEDGDRLTLFRINSNPALSAAATYIPALTQVDNTTWTPMDQSSELPTEGDLYAFCPGGASYVSPQLSNENRATFKLPSTEFYRENTCPVEGFFMASKLEEGQDAFYFRNICGLLRLKLYSPNNRVVTSIVIKDKAHHLSGDVSLKIDKVDPETLTSLYQNYDPSSDSYLATLNEYIQESGYTVINANDQITLNCGNGVQLGTTSATAANFYITLRPLALRAGCVITINCADGYSYTIDSNKNNIIGPNIVRNMAAVNIR